MTNQKLDETKAWRGTYKGLHFEIKHWGVGQSHTPANDGTWNYYVWLPERKLLDFATHWLEGRVVKIIPESLGFVAYDYCAIPAANVDWHGGVTYYAKHGEVEGFRSIELGCDYNHLWDHERGERYTLDEVVADVQRTIDELQPLLKL